jgi:outer membrane lipoprotein-sorting protein
VIRLDRWPVSISWATVLVAFLLSCHSVGLAEGASADIAIQGKERAQVLDRLEQREREVTSVRATVLQKKRHPLLREEAVSEGTLLFKRPNQVRWEVVKPERIIIVMDGHTLTIYRPDRNEAERRDLRQDLTSRAAVEFLTSGMSLDVAELEKRFLVDLYRENQRLAVKLIPRSRLIAQAIASVTIYEEENEAIPRQIVIEGQKGDRTETTLTQVTINPQVPEDAFTLRLGSGVRVTDVGSPLGERGGDR